MRQIRVLCTLLAAACLTGCVSPGGSGYSDDKFCYVSSNQSPKTVTVMDTRTRQVVWSAEVPVGQELVIKFFEGSDPKVYMPDLMKYGYAKAGSSTCAWQSSIPVPSAESRRVDWTIRTIPELAAGTAPQATTGTPAQPAATATKPKAAAKQPGMIDLPETEAPKTNPEPVREVK